MAIKYSKTLKSSNAVDDFGTVMNETQSVFTQKHNLNIIGSDFESILSTPSLYEEYVEGLTESLGATEKEQIEVLAENLKETIFNESMGGIQPYASLSLPMIIKLWARLGLKYALPTQPVTQPAFKIPFIKPYIIDPEDGFTKHYLPESINMIGNGLASNTKLESTVSLTGGKTTEASGALLTDEQKSKGVALDRKFSVKSITYPDGRVHQFTPYLNIDLHGRIYSKIDEVFPVVGETPELHVEDTILGSVDLETGEIEVVTLLGTATAIEIIGFISSESHSKATNVSFDTELRDITIGTGQHLEASLPMEMLQDAKAMFNIDGAAQMIDLLSNIAAQEVDLDIASFLMNSYESTPVKYTKSFNVYPSAQFTLNPIDWKSGLRTTIDYMATEIRSDFKAYQGYFVIVGHPLDVNLIPDVNWDFVNSNDDFNGISVQYSMGAMNGLHNYKIISSDLLDDGAMYMFFVPTQDNFKTYTYYPYTFNVVQNYLNTRMEKVPSIMLTKRYTIEEFTPIIGKIVIQNNDGMVYAESTQG